MSHAVVLVALSPQEILAAGGIEDAVAHQMAPFDENTANECFADGTRWDWWAIGGRWQGEFDGADWIKRKDLNLELMAAEHRRDVEQAWERHASEKHHHDLVCSVREGETREQFLERKTRGPGLAYYAFLKNREWHERDRMGWWGMSAATECEIKAKDDGKDWEGRCMHELPEMGAKVFSWTGPKDSGDVWAERYFKRFVERLDPETTLVVVDYHV